MLLRLIDSQPKNVLDASEIWHTNGTQYELNRELPDCTTSLKNSRSRCSTIFFEEASDAIFCIPTIKTTCPD